MFVNETDKLTHKYSGIAIDPHKTRAQLFLNRCQQDPNFFCDVVLGEHPWDIQKKVLESVKLNRRTVVRSCHGAGKTYTAALTAIWFLVTHPNSIVATTAPTFRQVEKVLWQEIRRIIKNSKLPLGLNPLLTEIKIQDGWFAFGFSTNDPDAVQGLHSDTGWVLLILDEACGVARPIWESAEGVLTSPTCRLLAIGNPTDPTGAFADEFKSPGTNKITISAFDTPNFTTHKRKRIKGLISPEWVEEKRRIWGEGTPMWQARVLGEFPDISNDVLFPLSWIEKSMALELEPGPVTNLGVDVARMGNDETVIARARGPVIDFLATRHKLKTTETTGLVISLAKQHKVNEVRVDDIGVGGGVTDQLEEAGINVVGINVGLPARDSERFLNLRAELAWGLRERLEHGKIQLPDDEELLAQLSGIKYSFTARGQIKVESKDDMRKRGLPSPDRADALILAASGFGGVPMVKMENLHMASAWLGDFGM
jgi:hypothetical protein